MIIEDEESVDILKDYTVLKQLGEGGYARVYLAENNRSLAQVAIKVINKGSMDARDLLYTRNEVRILSAIDHPNVVRMLDSAETDREIFVVLEYMRGGELFDRIVERGCFSQAEAATDLKTLVEAVRYCHSNGIVHRDLKPENILYDSEGPNGVLKIADFGVSRVLTHPQELLSTIVGSVTYQAPEVLAGQKYSDKCDIYSLGCILYTLLCGFPPFDDERPDCKMMIMAGRLEFPSPEWDAICAEAKDLIQKMMEINPANRFSADEVLKHPFFVSSQKSKNQSQMVSNLGNYTSRQKKKVKLNLNLPLRKTGNAT